MAHFAELDEDNKVVNVVVFNNDDINKHGGDLSVEAEKWVATTPNTTAEQSVTGKPGVRWKQTSYNSNFRKNYGGIGDYYDQQRDAFIRIQKPFPSWLLDENTCRWKAPQPWPNKNSYTDEKNNEIFFNFDWNEEFMRFQALHNNIIYYWDNINLIWKK
jgi:hypothetical protein